MLEVLGITQDTTFYLITTGVSLILTSAFVKWYRMYSYFSKLGIPGPKPLPIIGNFHQVIKRGMPYNDLEMTRIYGKTFGYFEGTTPIVLTTDPKLLKSLLIKDFHVFTNRRVLAPVEPFDKFLSLIKDDDWKNVRAILSTTFTTGKLKSMSKLMVESSNQLMEHLSVFAEKDENFDGKQYFGGLSLDVICSCCFGFSIDSIKEPDNEVIQHLKKMFVGSNTADPRLLLLILFPSLAIYLAQKGMLEVVPKKSLQFLKSLTFSIIERRKNKTEYREDFIQTMIENEQTLDTEETNSPVEENQWNPKDIKYLRKKLSHAEIFSQAIMFLLAGFETTLNTLNFIAYNLAKNQDVQQKLIDEIERVLENHNEKITYESVAEMKYMNMVIDETLRIFPAAIRLDRVASEDFEFEGMKIKKGQLVVVPLWALHYNKDVFPDPERFDPERFSEENKKLRDSNNYLPFGNGPRTCLAMRFVQIEMKIALAKILTKFRFETCDKTPEKLEIDSSGFGRSKLPIILKIKKRL